MHERNRFLELSVRNFLPTFAFATLLVTYALVLLNDFGIRSSQIFEPKLLIDLAYLLVLLTIPIISEINNKIAKTMDHDLVHLLVYAPFLILQCLSLFNLFTNLISPFFVRIFFWNIIIFLFYSALRRGYCNKQEKQQPISAPLPNRYDKTFNFFFIANLICFIIFLTWNIYFIQSSDNFNLAAAKSLYDNGTFFYPRNLQITYLMNFFFNIFGFSILTARLPFILIGTLTMLFVYGATKKLFDSKVAVISALLFSLSPVVIEKTLQIREYGENFLISSAVLFGFLYFSNKGILKIYLFTFISTALIFIYSKIVHNYTIQSLILLNFFTSYFYTFMYFSKFKRKILSLFIFASCIMWFTLFYLFDKFITGFNFLSYEPYWFQLFFDPSIQYPMQWFSTTNISTISIFFLFCIPVFLSKFEIRIFFISFLLFVLTFVFKFNNELSYIPTRYLYHLYPIYILIFSISIVFYFDLQKNIRTKSLFGLTMIVFFINPINLWKSINHEFVTTWPINDKTRPTSIGTRMDVNQFLHEVDQKKLFSINKPLVLSNFDPSWLILHYSLRMSPDRSFSDNGKYKYDIPENIFLENNYWNIHELSQVVNKNDTGAYITRKSANFETSAEYNLAKFNLEVEKNEFQYFTWSK